MDEKNIVRLFDNENEYVQMDEFSFHTFVRNFHGNKAIVLIYLTENMDKRTNIFYGTCTSISKELKLSRPTVSKIMNYMKDLGVVKMKQVGVWEIDMNKVMNTSA